MSKTSPVAIVPAPYVRLSLFATISGSTEQAICCKIKQGKSIKGRQYRRSPDREIYVSIRGFSGWVEGR